MITSNRIISEDISTILRDDIDWNYFKNKTVLVTGASGFIATYIVLTLLALGNIKVIALVRNKEKALLKFAPLMSNNKLSLVVSDVCAPLSVTSPVDIIIHAASQASPKYYGADPVGTLKANTLGTANMLDLAAKTGTEKFVYISSGEVYGVLDGSIAEVSETYTGNVDITNVRSCYAESKRMGETMCVCWAHQAGFHVNMLRLSHTYGPGIALDDGRVFADFVRNILHNENIVLNSDGKAKRGFVYITDMITALFRVLLYAGNMQAYNIASDTETGIYELACILCGLYPEKGLQVEFAPNVFAKGYIQSASKSGLLSNKKIKDLGWLPTIDVATGFKRMIESYLSQENLR